MHLDAPALQLLGDDAGGADLFETDFGMGVDVAANGSEFVGIAVDAVNGGHVSYPIWRDLSLARLGSENRAVRFDADAGPQARPRQGGGIGGHRAGRGANHQRLCDPLEIGAEM